MDSTTLTEYLDLIETGILNPEDQELFRRILKQSEAVLLLTDSDLAFEMEMSRPTINRWRSGSAAPLVMMRRSVFNWLKKRTKLMIRKTQSINDTTTEAVSKASAKELDSSSY